MLILGIESSCDETAAAVVRDGRHIVSSVIASQADLHSPWGGVVPELASREHLEKIGPTVEKAMFEAGTTFDDIDAVAVTVGPGLIGSLLVGVCYAKSLAYSIGKPLIGVNHIEGHACSVAFENPPVQYPALALIVSGGHTNIFYVPREGEYKLVSRTRDDAAGEAFDKVAKMLGLGYPGGPAVEAAATDGDVNRFRFANAKISDGRPDLSFSGLKTAVARCIRENDIETLRDGTAPTQEVKDIAAGFQSAVVSALMTTFERIGKDLGPKTLIVAGGVACNRSLRAAAAAVGERLGISVLFPSKHLSTDNAAMIAAAGYRRFRNGDLADYELTADITMRLQNIDDDAVELRSKGAKYRL